MVPDLGQWHVPHFPIVAAAEVNGRECDPSVNVSIIFSALSYNFKILLCLNSLERLLTLTVLWVNGQLCCRFFLFPSTHLRELI